MKKGYVLLGMALLAAVFTSCDFYVRRSSSKGQRVRVVNKDVVVQSFEKVQIAGSFDVTYKQGDSCTVRIEAPQDAMKEIDIYTDGETLYIGPKRKNLLFSLKSLNQHHKIYVYASSPDLTSAEIAGSGEFDVNGHLDTDRLELSIAGSADMKLIEAKDIDCGELNTSIAGSGDMKFGGRTKKYDESIAGSGKVEKSGLIIGK